QQEKSDIDLTVAGTKDAINMVEAGAHEVTEDVMLDAIMFGHEEIKKLVGFQEEIIRAVGKDKAPVSVPEKDRELAEKVETEAYDKLTDAIRTEDKLERETAIDEVIEENLSLYEEEEEETYNEVKEILDDMVQNEVRRLITKEKVRPDGRKIDEIRPLSSRIDVLPRAHGSGLFTRGQTQALSVCTLGALGDVQIIDGLGLEESKRFMHHYNFPQYSVGETGPIRAPGRREIGHG